MNSMFSAGKEFSTSANTLIPESKIISLNTEEQQQNLLKKPGIRNGSGTLDTDNLDPNFDGHVSEDDSDSRNDKGSTEESRIDSQHSSVTSIETHYHYSKMKPASSANSQSEYSLNIAPGLSSFIHPKSSYTGFEPPFPISSEQDAVKDLKAEFKRQELNSKKETDFPPHGKHTEDIEFDLSSFSIYVSNNVNKYQPLKLEGLQHHYARRGKANFLFDGILSVGNVRRYVQGVPFMEVPVGNYGKEEHSVISIWIRSTHNRNSPCYYRLKEPAPEYERYHLGFTWIANLAKHFVDFCHSCGPMAVTTSKFRQEFAQWIWGQHKVSSEFQEWFNGYGSRNFLPAVAANIVFLNKECYGMDDELRSQPIFSELLTMDAVPKQKIEEVKTIVTPYIYNLFSHLRFGSFLKPVEPITVSEIPFPTVSRVSNTARSDTAQSLFRGEHARGIRVGDVISLLTDDAAVGSVWKAEPSRHRDIEHCWYAYILAVYTEESEEPEFEVLWLYQSSDTSCVKMKYPYPNELFMSNHCNCGKKRERIRHSEVLSIEDVLWHSAPPKDDKQLFVRQTWMDQERFVTLQEHHKGCLHHPHSLSPRSCSILKDFPIGQTVLVVAPKTTMLDPFEVVKYTNSEDGRSKVVLRRLLRRQQFDLSGRPNELIYTEKTETVPTSRLQLKCLVRYYSEDDVVLKRIPAPYCRDGSGNAFYICTRLVEVEGQNTLVPILEHLPPSLLQGFNPLGESNSKQLRGLDIYCGGGNFGRGLEEGGAVCNEWAVDIYDAAIHTYRANRKRSDSNGTKMFYGSVNDLLVQAMAGNPKGCDLIPTPSEVDFISAGSPCQGFSNLNSNKDNAKGLANQSLLASVAAYVDFYRPKYGILENVLNMSQKGKGRDDDPLSQLICAIVGMGYQLQVFVLDAWSCGSPQSRSRIFVSFAAPGLEPIRHPELSHSHPPGQKNFALGLLSNGKAFGERRMGLTPFRYVNIGDATSHLPAIDDASTLQCTKYPYHVVAGSVTSISKQQISSIPTYPRGMNFAQTWRDGKGVMTRQERLLFPSENGEKRQNVLPKSRAWGRINPKDLMPTVIVSTRAEDSRMGRCLHWNQHRTMTVAEAQIAQGFPEDEVLVGTPTDWWKLLGNSVCRTVSLALGLSLREAWLTNLSHEFDDHSENLLPLRVQNCVRKSIKTGDALNESAAQAVGRSPDSLKLTQTLAPPILPGRPPQKTKFPRMSFRHQLGTDPQTRDHPTKAIVEDARAYALIPGSDDEYGLTSLHPLSTLRSPSQNLVDRSVLSRTNGMSGKPIQVAKSELNPVKKRKTTVEVVVDLSSSDDGGKPKKKRGLGEQRLQTKEPTFTSTYIPVNNSSFSVYENTSRFLNGVRATQGYRER
ncbi:S-adenosyl-L-methionine-dependent methyltransferase [Glarea lozoyensis ATCC 20868]|uniref:DNA (cytosine-5-)-methyltransferase n=1 Tax=Glarea lozoyensis (strain ATCC 20868 / MF5171) TaxID=1116229 RepID=S3D772_GLAL2|nr:S-adenosyl-L-methionine-dependent methyltransferase [Glarea lozoyensis ATCC 20868]EPE27851.1 S-adenosyl-L-methionine-dependent methyltransferase [Glarea lozoyensis ATCC 20868]